MCASGNWLSKVGEQTGKAHSDTIRTLVKPVTSWGSRRITTSMLAGSLLMGSRPVEICTSMWGCCERNCASLGNSQRIVNVGSALTRRTSCALMLRDADAMAASAGLTESR
jgi:hypothetical protein